MRDNLSFYVPLSAAPLAEKLGIMPKPVMPVDFWKTSTDLEVPKQPLGPSPLKRVPNILFIAIEGGRADALEQKVMPNVSMFADESWRLNCHFSSGNNTIDGFFGLFYGLSGNYLDQVSRFKKAPPICEFLETQNYDVRLMTAADSRFFLGEGFTKYKDRVSDTWNCPHRDRDKLMTENFVRFLEQRSNKAEHKRPFLGLLFYDASHLPYEFPDEDAFFEKRVKGGQLNFTTLAAFPASSRNFKGCYLNALHYVDRQIGRVLQSLRLTGNLENTIVIIVGDHGEEFGECSHFGHVSSFNRYQTQTLAVLHLPGESSKIITNLTSHVDFVPTILTWMGVTNAPEDYSTGMPIQGERTHSFVVANDLGENLAIIKKTSVNTFRFKKGIYYRTLEEQELEKGDPSLPSSEEISEMTQVYYRFLK